MSLININPGIEKKKFFRHHGLPCEFSPSAGVLFEEHMTGAIVVIHNTPIFIGDKLWYQSRHSGAGGFVTLTGFAANVENKEYFFAYEGTSNSNIVVTEQLIHELILLDRPKPKYNEMSFNGKFIRGISTKCTSTFPIKITDGRGNEYWADSNNTVNALGSNLQVVCDQILAAIATQKTVRVMIDGKASTLITHEK
jgi:hypothetical protein